MIFPYSFKDLQVGFNSPVTGPQSFQGQLGFGEFTVEMMTDRTVLEPAADGAIMGSSIAGNAGHFVLLCQQTSFIHDFLNGWYNALLVGQNNGDISNWFAASMSVQNLLIGTSHVATGLAPLKFPSYGYGAQGRMVTWTLPAADIING